MPPATSPWVPSTWTSSGASASPTANSRVAMFTQGSKESHADPSHPRYHSGPHDLKHVCMPCNRGRTEESLVFAHTPCAAVDDKTRPPSPTGPQASLTSTNCPWEGSAVWSGSAGGQFELSWKHVDGDVRPDGKPGFDGVDLTLSHNYNGGQVRKIVDRLNRHP